MGEKSKRQRECVINRINPQTTPQIATLSKNEKLPNELISDFGLHSVHHQLMLICGRANRKNEPIFKQTLDSVTFVSFCSSLLPRPVVPKLLRKQIRVRLDFVPFVPRSAFSSVFQPNQTESREGAELANVKFKVSPSESYQFNPNQSVHKETNLL